MLLSIIGLLVLFKSHPSGEELWSSVQQQIQLKELRECACQNCIAGGDEWFMAHFNQKVDPFFTQQSNLSAQTFAWWKVNMIYKSFKVPCGSSERISNYN